MVSFECSNLRPVTLDKGCGCTNVEADPLYRHVHQRLKEIRPTICARQSDCSKHIYDACSSHRLATMLISHRLCSYLVHTEGAHETFQRMTKSDKHHTGCAIACRWHRNAHTQGESKGQPHHCGVMVQCHHMSAASALEWTVQYSMTAKYLA